MSRPRAALVLAVLLVLSLVYTTRAFVLDPPYPMWDEGTHLTDALGARDVLREGSLKSFLLYLVSPLYYPFVHPLLVAGVWTATGVSLVAARAVSIASSVLLVGALVGLARATLPPASARQGALLATALLLSSPTVRELQGLVMLELTGTLLTVAALLAHVRWMRAPTWPRAALVALLVLGCFFTKYNFGIVLGAALLAHVLLHRTDAFVRLLQQSVLLGLPALVWLYQEPAKKMELLLEYVSSRHFEVSLARRIAFPVVSLARDLVAVLPVGLVVLAGLALAARRIALRSPHGILLVLPLVQALALALTTNQQVRYLLPALPAALLASAGSLVAWASPSRVRRLALGALGAVSCTPLALPPGASLTTPSYTARADLRALGELASARFAGRPLLLVGAFNEFPPSLARFEGIRIARARTGADDPAAPPLFVQAPPAFRATRTRYVAEPSMAVASALGRGLDAYRARFGEPVPVLVLGVSPGSPFRYLDYEAWNAWQEPMAEAVARTPGAVLVEKRGFASSGLTARFYELRAAP